MNIMDGFLLVTKLLGGLSLFIFGMSMMSDALQRAAGKKLKKILFALTKNRFSGLAIGTLISFLIHSSSTTVMLVSFINAGLIGFTQSLPIMLGANIGTTLSMQIVSFNLSKYCYFAIATGFLSYFLTNSQKAKNIGHIILGFGLLYLGMSLMTDAVTPFKNLETFYSAFQYLSTGTLTSVFLALFFSTLFTGIVQSSGATIGIIFALSGAGILTSFEQTLPLILGAHIGTCATAMLGCIGTQKSAKRFALSHLLFNIIGAGFALLMYKFYTWLIPLTDSDLVRQVANAHSIVQIINALIFLPFIAAYSKFLHFVFPNKNSKEEISHLHDELLDTPEAALVAAIKELKRMSTVSRDMFQNAMRGLLDLDFQRFQAVARDEDILDNMKIAITNFLHSLAERKLSRRQSVMLQYLLSAASELERIGDHIETMIETTTEKTKNKVWFDDDSMLDLITLFKKADHIIMRIGKSFEPSYYESSIKFAGSILEERDNYVKFSADVRNKYTRRILDQKENAISGIYFNQYITCFNKIVKHAKTVAVVEKEPLFFIKKHKMEKKATKAEPCKGMDLNHKVGNYDAKIFTPDDEN